MTQADQEEQIDIEPRFLSRKAVAKLFGVSTSTVTRWAREGLLKAIRTPGGHYRFPAAETIELAKHSEIQSK